jgi:hypothetical protein
MIRKGDVVEFVDQFDDGDEVTLDDLAPLFEPKTYTIVRFHQDKPQEIISGGMTLDEAQAWCSLDSTQGEGWFDGYREE